MAGDQDANLKRLRVLMMLFDISIQDVATVGGVSRPLVSGLLSGRPGIKANGLFVALEQNLGALVDAKRRRPFFELAGAPVDEVEAALYAVMPTPGMSHGGGAGSKAPQMAKA